MKIQAIFFILFLVLSGAAFGQKNKKLGAYLQTKQFSAPDIGNYIEIHVQFVGPSIKYLPKDNGLIGEIAVRFLIEDNDSVIASDAYRLETPFMVDSIIEDFYDVKRFALNPGDYSCRIELLDLNSDADPVVANFVFSIEEYRDALAVSDILVAEMATKDSGESPFFKSGYAIIPRLVTFYPAELSSIPAYFEIYNFDQLEDSVFALKQTVVNAETGEEIPELTKFSKHKADPVVPIIRSVDISAVPTGKYVLNYAVLDRQLVELASQSYDFERSNDMEMMVNPADMILDPAFQASITRDSVEYYLASLIPISKPGQVRSIIDVLKTKNEENMRKMIQAFWKQTAPLDTYDQWIHYKIQVQKVEKLYATNYQDGYETDRGRVYLQYGDPSRTVAREISSSEYPYEIWEYNKIGVFSNKRFIFYNPDLIGNNYRLLHSDMVGELKNPRWQYELNKRNTTNGNVDDPGMNVRDTWGNNSDVLFGR